jgi:hypothetical protein
LVLGPRLVESGRRGRKCACMVGALPKLSVISALLVGVRQAGVIFSDIL